MIILLLILLAVPSSTQVTSTTTCSATTELMSSSSLASMIRRRSSAPPAAEPTSSPQPPMGLVSALPGWELKPSSVPLTPFITALPVLPAGWRTHRRLNATSVLEEPHAHVPLIRSLWRMSPPRPTSAHSVALTSHRQVAPAHASPLISRRQISAYPPQTPPTTPSRGPTQRTMQR